MRCTGPLGYALSGSAVLALLAGCSGGGGSSSPALIPAAGSQPQSVSRSLQSIGFQRPQWPTLARPGAAIRNTPDHSPGFADPDAKKKGALLFSDFNNSDVYVYSTAGKLTGTITGLTNPQGLAGDKSGNLYIANTDASNVLVYKSDYKTLESTLSDANEYPADVDISSAGIVAATNIFATSGAAGSVSIFAKGQTTPCVTVGNSSWSEVFFGAFDTKGDFYVDGFSTSGTVLVGVVKGGCKAKTITTLTTKNSLEFPGGVQVNTKGDILVDDQEAFAIYTYKPPTGSSLGTPISTTSLSGASDPVSFSLTSTDADLWTADAGLIAGEEYKYPAGGSSIKSIPLPSGALPIGALAVPAEQP